jgi:uncharacterized protein
MSVNRYDRVDAPEWMTQTFTQTPEGFIKGRACVTNIGVFPYKFADGHIEYELRHPDDVFEQESMDSLRMKVLTNNHPSVMVTAENIKDYQVGNLGNNPAGWDNIHLTIDMIIQDKATIDEILRGKRELSCGYTADLVDESGVWLGMPYTKRQKNIRYNHVAVVDSARAGEAARIKLDSADAILCEDATVAVAKDNKPNKGEEMAENMKTVKIDSVDYQAEAQVIVALNQTQTKLDSAEKDLKATVDAKSAVEAERDSFKERLDAAEILVADMKKAKLDEGAINARVAEKIALMDAAKKAEVEVKMDMADIDIKKAIVLKVFETAKLDGRDDVYVNARFDCAVEELTRREQEKADAAARVAGGAPAVKTDGAENSAEEARKRYLTRLYGAK